MDEGFIIPDNLTLPGVRAIFTTRMNGDMNDPLKRQNLSFLKGLDSFILPVQRHTDRVRTIMNPLDKSPIEADAIITPLNGIILGVLVADCVPILIYAPDRGVVAAVHAGWRGTAYAITKKTLRHLEKEFNISLSETIISIGPSIRWCCYEVDRDVLKAIEDITGSLEEYSKEKGNGKYCLDLATANRIQAASVGVKNIWISEECTFCYPDRFYSYRYNKGTTGRQACLSPPAGGAGGRQGGFIGMI